MTDKKLNNLSQKYNWRCYYESFRDREYCEQLYANKLDNLEEIRKMEKLLEIHKLPNLFKKKEKFCDLVNSAEILEFMKMIEYFHP